MHVKHIQSTLATATDVNNCDQYRRTKWEVLLTSEEVWGIRVLYVASNSKPNSDGNKQQRRFLGLCHWNIKRWCRLQEWFESAAQ